MGASRRRRRDDVLHRLADDRGAAVVESSLVLVLLVFLLLALLQLGFALHIRNTLVASAAEGARYAANADRSPEEGAARTRDLVTSAVGAEYATGVRAGTEVVDGVTTIVVEIEAPLPILGPFGLSDGLVVRGHAFEESG